MAPDDTRHDFAIMVELFKEGTTERIVSGNAAESCGAQNIHDEEANALRAAEQMVRELFRRRRRQMGMEF